MRITRPVRRVLAVVSTATLALVMPASPALASRATTTTNLGGYCTLDGFNLPTVTGLLLKRLDYGSHANCFTATIAREIIVQSHLFDRSNNSHLASTSVARCYDCFEVSVISSYSTIITTNTRADSHITVHLYPSNGERFNTPAPPGCVVYNSGYSIYCAQSDYA